MTHTTHSFRSAGTAIAAVLALASTPSFGQDAAAPFPASPEPVIVVPDIAPPVPTVVVPTNQAPTVQPIPETTVETPAPQPVPSPSASAAPRNRAAAPAARTAPAPQARVPVSEPAIVEPTTALPAEQTAVEPVAVAPPVAPAAATVPVRPAANDNIGLLALVLGGLAFLALAIWGFIAIGRRKPVRRYAAEKTVPVAVAPATVVAEPALPIPEPVAAERPTEDSRVVGGSFSPRHTATSGALPHTGASVALPATIPEDYAERDALVKRMIAAKPDRANPFTDRGARTRRARLILQSLGRDFGETEPWIDLSQYPNNWPELARKRSAAA
jgi:hypothetical protein